VKCLLFTLIRFSLTLAALAGLFLYAGCSAESNSWSSKAFHNTTAHYNGYYYALDEIRKIEQTISGSRKDDYNQILRLFPRLDSVLSLTYTKETEEVIRMASSVIQHHPNSKWVDDSYVLVGKARLYSLDWGNAIQTFKYVNTKSKDPNVRHQALILLARTFTEHGEYNNAEAAFSYLEKEKLSKANRKNLYLEEAYYYQVRGDYDKMVRNLTQAAPLLNKKDRPGRIFFIIGQVYQKLGFEAEAYNYFRECLQTQPEYEVDFYARLYMAQVAEISRSRSIAAARKSFRILLKDTKNKDFKDKIYYEMGVFERKQNNITEAITDLNQAVRLGTNKQVDGEAYLRLGEIYYDTLRKYELAKAYYDSAVGSLTNSYENYAAIKQRQEVLTEFVTSLKIIQWQDSLLILAKLDSASLMALIKDDYEKKNLPPVKGRKKQRGNRIDISQAATGMATGTGLGSTDWYFGNPSAVVLGQQEFKRIWGNIPLEDNWRRSSRAMPPSSRPAIIAGTDAPVLTESPEVEVKKTDPVEEEFNRISKELPLTEEQVAKSLAMIEDAYFQLGDIYYFKLFEKQNAIDTYEKMLSRFPETNYRPEVLYKLYLMLKERSPVKSAAYAQELIAQFPETTFAKILVNPDYLLESSLVLEKQQKLYKEAYARQEQGMYSEAAAILEGALALEKTSFYPNLELLYIIIHGKTEPLARYQYELNQFIRQYPDSDLALYARQLATKAGEFERQSEIDRGLRFTVDATAPHYFILVYATDSKTATNTTAALVQFNKINFSDMNLNVSNLTMNDEQSLTMVTEFNSQRKAMEFYRLFIEKQNSLTEVKNYKFNTFVITKNNFDIFYRSKGLNEYIQFFEKIYRQQNP
jgi:tetratricopeptide (TPR) repeat protein